MVVKVALYGFKSLEAAFMDKLAQFLYDMNYTPSRADTDVWMRPDVKVNAFKYY